jgi:hypothetical protein
MNNVTEIVTLILAGRADAVATERELESTRRRLIAHPEARRAPTNA